MEYTVLSNGLKMPMEGFGVFQVRDKEECRQAVYEAIKAGYRLIDTAASYTNEDAVGDGVRRAISEGICTREELFITSKMWVQDMQNYEMAKQAIENSLKKNRPGISGSVFTASVHERLLQCVQSYGRCLQRRKTEGHRCI